MTTTLESPPRRGTTAYTTNDVMELTGMSYRMVDYWVRRGFVAPSQRNRGSGRRRTWTAQEVRAMRDVAAQYESAMQRMSDVLAELHSGSLWRDAMLRHADDQQ